MNILPKKRWHVRTKANIERVRRDEAKAAEDEIERNRKIQLAEQEARTDLLRKRSKVHFTKSDEIEKDGHINFFKDVEDSEGIVGGKNKEHEEEEKARQEKFEKDIGLLTYLGQNSHELKGEIPWYLKGELKASISSTDDEEAVGSKYKSKLDPLNDMKKYIDLKVKTDKNLFVCKKPVETKKRDLPSGSSKNQSLIEELRAKRLKREAEERRRSQKFLETLRNGGAAAPEPEVNPDDRTRRYNSQFNPDLARNNYARNGAGLDVRPPR